MCVCVCCRLFILFFFSSSNTISRTDKNNTPRYTIIDIECSGACNILNSRQGESAKLVHHGIRGPDGKAWTGGQRGRQKERICIVLRVVGNEIILIRVRVQSEYFIKLYTSYVSEPIRD